MIRTRAALVSMVWAFSGIIVGCSGDSVQEDATVNATTETAQPSLATTQAPSETTQEDGVGTTEPSGDGQEFPDVVAVEVKRDGEASTYDFAVTISSPYDTPERYADAWRVVAPDGTVLGVRELTHDHADEQPFTRSLDDVAIPDGIENVTVEGRDLVNGWGGTSKSVDLP